MSDAINTTEEIWKTIPGFHNYSASNLGRIKRTVFGNKHSSDGILKQKTQNCGYRYVSLSKDGVVYTRTVHRLVAAAFFEPDLIRKEINHKNGNKIDNRPENLEWMTRSENILHRADYLGMDNRGEKNLNARLTRDQVIAIRELLRSGNRQWAIAAQFGVGQQSISHINTGKTWKHI